MDWKEEIKKIVGQPESQTLEYKAVLPPSRNVAQILCSFANTEGGYLILGVTDDSKINGLSEDFHANTITHKALDLLTPKPNIEYQYVNIEDKKLYAIKVDKSDSIISVEGKVYIRKGSRTNLEDPITVSFNVGGYEKIKLINSHLEELKSDATYAKISFIEHYQSILKIVDDLGDILYPENPENPTTNQEGKILSRILFSSVVDNFETYLSDLLYEIFLAYPETLKSQQTVTIEEVLNCSDLQDFVKFWAKQKISKLQKGSVRGFIKDTKQISDLQVLNKDEQDKIEKILQIRHLYAHRNGIVDEKFLQFFTGEFTIGSEHRMAIKKIFEKLDYLTDVVNRIDLSAINKYKLSRSS
ncbi:helix-turn-helix domain-containing protein [uncultured Psychroserpens sp.]|uniref:AlbA family DNA-binding domain-containing protein n=1 Tax=uncultured Psychroserpens sp. TaxID=255436 RepID=UPI0026095334|nr:ATP-binding protein [uncultured Psychroserpens sp.]